MNINDFKDVSLSTLPKEWEVLPFIEVATLQRGKDLPKRLRTPGPYPVYGSNGIVDYHDQFVSDCPGVLVGRSGSVGKVSYSNGPYWPLNTSLWVKDFHNNDEKFIYYLLQSFNFQIFATGVSVPTLNRNLVHDAYLPLPPLPEQRAIAHVLTTVRKSIEATEQVIAAAKELKRSMMKHLFTYGPVPVNQVDQVPLKETEIGEVPEDWDFTELQQACELIVDCPHTTPKYLNDGVLVVRNFNIRDGRLKLDRAYYTSEEEYLERTSRAIPAEGDVLFSREAPIGKACIVPPETKLSLGQRTMLLRVNPARLKNSFLVYSFYSTNIRNLMEALATGVTAKHLNVGDVRRLSLPTPSLDVQLQISKTLQSVDNKVVKEEEIKNTLEDLFNSLLHHLMTGKVRITTTR